MEKEEDDNIIREFSGISGSYWRNLTGFVQEKPRMNQTWRWNKNKPQYENFQADCEKLIRYMPPKVEGSKLGLNLFKSKVLTSSRTWRLIQRTLYEFDLLQDFIKKPSFFCLTQEMLGKKTQRKKKLLDVETMKSWILGLISEKKWAGEINEAVLEDKMINQSFPN
mgnify:CR=1 FL=1